MPATPLNARFVFVGHYICCAIMKPHLHWSINLRSFARVFCFALPIHHSRILFRAKPQSRKAGFAQIRLGETLA